MGRDIEKEIDMVSERMRRKQNQRKGLKRKFETLYSDGRDRKGNRVGERERIQKGREVKVNATFLQFFSTFSHSISSQNTWISLSHFLSFTVFFLLYLFPISFFSSLSLSFSNLLPSSPSYLALLFIHCSNSLNPISLHTSFYFIPLTLC